MDSSAAGETLTEGFVIPVLKVLDGDTNAVDVALTQDTNGTEESFKLQSSTSRSISDASKGDEGSNDTSEGFSGKEKSKDNASDTANASKEKRQPKIKTRAVQSRFRSGLSNSKNNNSSNSKSGLSNSENNNSKNSLNCTISGPSASNSTGKSRTVRAQPPVKSVIGKSVSNLSRVTAHGASNLTSKSRPVKSTTNLNESILPGAGDFKKIGGSSKLHSTVLAERTMLGSTHNLFSTTLVGGFEHGKQKLRCSKKLDTTTCTLPELPDISAIRLDSTSASSDKSGDVTTLSAASEKDSSQEKSNEMREITYEELLREYSRYLQSVDNDAVSEDAFSKQLEELKVQLVFLDQLTSVKQMEADETKQKLELLNHHQYVLEAHKTQMEQLQKLGSLPEIEAALNMITRGLEKNLHQVKMDNLHVPENHETYRDDLAQALRDQIMCLSELDSLMEPRSHQLTSTLTLLDELQFNSQRIQQYEREVNQTSRLAIQEASLQIVAKQVNNASEVVGL